MYLNTKNSHFILFFQINKYKNFDIKMSFSNPFGFSENHYQLPPDDQNTYIQIPPQQAINSIRINRII